MQCLGEIFLKMAEQDDTKTILIISCMTRQLKNRIKNLVFSESGQLSENFEDFYPYVKKNDYILAIDDQGARNLNSEQIQEKISATRCGDFFSVLFVRSTHFDPAKHNIGGTKSKAKVRHI